MRRHLYTGGIGHYAVWDRIASLLMEAYLPAAQRAAVFRVAATIPGVTTIKRSEDAAGRVGIAAAMGRPMGTREEIIFDPETYQYLGFRVVVVDPVKAQALVASSALLRVTVADGTPPIKPSSVRGHSR
jgi:hypothetical protein